MSESAVMERVQSAVTAVRRKADFHPEIGIVLGTGLGALARALKVEAEVPYRELPGFPVSTVESHAGKLLFGTLAGRRVAALQGRVHAYEGYSLPEVVFPVRMLRALGCHTLLLAGAVGGMNPLWERGDLVLLSDHLNLFGDSPLAGPNDDRIGPRFPDMSEAYDSGLRAHAREAARQLGLVLREGVYAGVPGPALETRAEYRMLRHMGADVVGMSTVPEVIAAVHAGMKVLALAVVTDQCLPDALHPVTLEEIIATAERAEAPLSALITRVLERTA